jgi:PLP dependent protein
MIAENLAHVEATLQRACDHSQRPREAVTLVAVCKQQPVARILEAAAAGVRHFGENRVEEANPKIAEVGQHTDAPLTWHLIGTIQSRKVRDVLSHDGVRRFGLVHSLDDLPLAERFSRQLAERGGEPMAVLAQVNVSGEASKSGFDAAGWEHDGAVLAHITQHMRALSALPYLALRGLMTMAPIVPDMQDARPVFWSLRLLRDHLQDALGHPLPDLSMGMTDDYPVAVEEGATLVRVGRALFAQPA